MAAARGVVMETGAGAAAVCKAALLVAAGLGEVFDPADVFAGKVPCCNLCLSWARLRMVVSTTKFTKGARHVGHLWPLHVEGQEFVELCLH